MELLSASVAEVVRTHPELGRYSALREAIEATAIDQLETRQDASHQALRMLCVTSAAEACFRRVLTISIQC